MLTDFLHRDWRISNLVQVLWFQKSFTRMEMSHEVQLWNLLVCSGQQQVPREEHRAEGAWGGRPKTAGLWNWNSGMPLSQRLFICVQQSLKDFSPINLMTFLPSPCNLLSPQVRWSRRFHRLTVWYWAPFPCFGGSSTWVSVGGSTWISFEPSSCT